MYKNEHRRTNVKNTRLPLKTPIEGVQKYSKKETQEIWRKINGIVILSGNKKIIKIFEKFLKNLENF